MTDATGSRTLDYLAAKPLELDTETLAAFYNGRILKRQYDTSYRPNGFELGTSTTPDADLSQTGSFVGATGLLDHVDTAAARGTAATFKYAYKSYSPLVDNYATGNFKQSYDYDGTSAARVTRAEGSWLGASVARFDLGYDGAGRVQSAKQSGAAFSDYYAGTTYSSVYNYYFYDERGQLKTAVMYRGTPPTSGAPASTDELPGRRFEYRYDGAGNRLTVGATGTSGGGDNVYTPNALNQYANVENNNVPLLGTAASGASVSASSTGTTGGPITVNQTDRTFAADAAPANASGPVQGQFSVTASLSGNNDTATRKWVVPEQTQTLDHDADGNVSADGVWSYAYDAENRLIEMDSLLPAGQGYTRLKLQFKYDYLGRRVEKIVTDLDGVLATTDRRYLYDGWALIAELDDTGATVERSYTWGVDVTGTGASAGVGALLQVTDNTVSKTYYPTYDGNGSVATLVRSDGTVAVTYEYSPFGRLLRSEINPALSTAEQQALATEPFRYSTKFTDAETGLVYYGLRYYNPTLGRFINRDPAEEAGGVNLYAFCGNNPLGRWDVLGMDPPAQLPPYIYSVGPCDETQQEFPQPDGSIDVYLMDVCPNEENGGEDVSYEFQYKIPAPTQPAGGTDNSQPGDTGTTGSTPTKTVPSSPPKTTSPAPNKAHKCKGLKQRAAVAERVYSTNHANISAGGVYSGYAPGSIELASLENSAAGLGLGAYGLHKTLSGPWRAGRFPWVSINNQGNLREVGQFGRYSSYAAIGFDTYGAVDSARQGDWTGAGFSAANVGADAAGLIMGGLEYTVAGPVGALVLAGGQFAINSYVFARTTADATANLNANAATGKQSADNALKTLADVKSQMRELGCPP